MEAAGGGCRRTLSLIICPSFPTPLIPLHKAVSNGTCANKDSQAFSTPTTPHKNPGSLTPPTASRPIITILLSQPCIGRLTLSLPPSSPLPKG